MRPERRYNHRHTSLSNYYLDYVWKEGIPYGIKPINDDGAVTYKIAMDPYRKRIAVEKYESKQFRSVIYDSGLLDFRHLKPAEQTAWQKIILSENAETVKAAIYNQDDRLVVIENYLFENKVCRRCSSSSGHGVALSEQRMYYKSLGDAFDGVVLYDINQHPVMLKHYEIDETGEFTELLEELWDGKVIAEKLAELNGKPL